MALFGSEKRTLLARLRKREWQSAEELQELFSALNKMDVKASEVVWLLGADNRNLRYYGAWLIRQKHEQMPDLVRTVIGALSESSSVARNYLINALVEQEDERLFQELDRMLESKSREQRTLAIDIILAHPSGRVGKYLLKLIRHEDREYRWRALQKIIAEMPPRTVPDKRIRRLFFELASDPDERIRIRALQQLAEHPDQEIAELLLARLLQDNYGVKTAVVPLLEKLQRIPGFNLLDKALSLLSHSDDVVRRTALELALKQADPKDVLRRILALQRQLVGWMRDRIIRTIKASGADMVEPLVSLLQHPERDTRLRALLFAHNIDDTRLLAPVIKLLRDGDWWLRMLAMDLIGRLGTDEGIAALIPCLRDDEVRWSAVEALARIGGPKAMRPIVGLLKDPKPEVRLQVISALETHDDPRALALLERTMQKDPELEVRERALTAFRAISANHAQTVDEDSIRQKFAYDDVDNVIDKLLVEVRKVGASDLHITPNWYPEMRLHGVLTRIGDRKLSSSECHKLLMGLLEPRKAKLFATHHQLDFCHVIPGVGRYRANMLRDRVGIGAVFRTIPNEVPSYASTRLPPHLRDIVSFQQGIVVISGRMGAGKSTTLAALVNLLNDTRHHHILTVEDPIEFVHPFKNSLINQRELDKHTESFGAALRGALREDPDVIVIGEMRDQETMALAMTAAETGHLVLATMHTTRAVTSIDRLIDAFPAREQGQIRSMLSESLRLVINQNLAPRADKKGRVAYHEILMCTNPVRSLIRDNRTHLIGNMMTIGKEMGMQTVDMALKQLADDGLISAEEAYRRADDKSAFEAFLPKGFLEST